MRHGLLHEERRRFPQAIAVYLDLLRQNPNQYEVLCRLGFCYLQTGQLAAAIEWLGRAVALAPGNPKAYSLRGVALRVTGKHDAALKDFDRVILLNPASVDAHFNRANALRSLRRYNESIEGYQAANKLDPARLDIMNNLAAAYAQLGEWQMATEVFEKLLQRQQTPDGFYNLGFVKCELLHFEEALDCFESAIRLQPDYAEAYSSRGYALSRIGKHEEALRSCERAIALNPTLVDARINQGKVLAVMGQYEQAVSAFSKAVELNPRNALSYRYRAVAYKELWRFSEARSDYDRALAINSNDVEARCSKAHLLLYLEEYAEGFRLYKARWHTRNSTGVRLSADIPEWNGKPFAGHLLLWAEQGIGDEVFYASLLSLIPNSNMRITLAADSRLFPIYERSFPHIQLLDRKVQNDLLLSGFDAQAPIGDLGGLLEVDAARVTGRRYPFLVANPLTKAGFSARFRSPGGRPVVGISWKSINKEFGLSRSVDLVNFLQVLQGSGTRLVNLQYGDVSAEIARARELTGEIVEVVDDLDIFNDLDGLLALIDACDFVITIDNVTAHLAGSIGRRTAVMVPCGKAEIWYWQGKKVSAWYPSLDLLYQQRSNDWEAVLAAAAAWLRRQLADSAIES
jgi:tetratricopeptide (TPR) repeat protein